MPSGILSERESRAWVGDSASLGTQHSQTPKKNMGLVVKGTKTFLIRWAALAPGTLPLSLCLCLCVRVCVCMRILRHSCATTAQPLGQMQLQRQPASRRPQPCCTVRHLQLWVRTCVHFVLCTPSCHKTPAKVAQNTETDHCL